VAGLCRIRPSSPASASRARTGATPSTHLTLPACRHAGAHHHYALTPSALLILPLGSAALAGAGRIALRAMAARPDSTAMLQNISVPVLAITGLDDALIAPDRFVRLGNDRHYVMFGFAQCPQRRHTDFAAV